jgi:hypothetical protein
MMLSQRQTLIESSWVISHVSLLNPIMIALMMGTEIVPKTLAIFNELTRLIAQEGFTNEIYCYKTTVKDCLPRM